MRAPRRRTLRKGGRRAEAPFQGASAALAMATLAGAACVGRHELPCRHTAREFSKFEKAWHGHCMSSGASRHGAADRRQAGPDPLVEDALALLHRCACVCVRVLVCVCLRAWARRSAESQQ